jgi:hypothetical protein
MMMSRTACCFVALGISFAAFAAACGDDDGGGGTGGNGGNGASGGSGGSSGGANVAGEGGAAGSGTAGSGTAGSGTAGSGTAGSGTAGSGAAGSAGAAGSGTVEEGDAGPDSGTGNEPDSGIVDAGIIPPPVLDGGVNGDCNFAAGQANIEAPTGQDYIISHVIFEGTTAHVFLRVITANSFADPQKLCSGPTDGECIDIPDDGVSGDRAPGTQLQVDITGVDPAAGELAFMSDLPSAGGSFILAYVNWGGYTSVDPGGAQASLESLAVVGTGSAAFWTTDDSIALDNNDNAFYVNGDNSAAANFLGCTATEIP